jgi:hypothetical protein
MPNFLHGTKLPTFPSTWYHCVYGAAEIRTYEDFLRLGEGWRETAALADADRTETDARIVMNHNDQVKREQIIEEARRLNIPPNQAIVRNSAQAAEATKEGKAQPY